MLFSFYAFIHPSSLLRVALTLYHSQGVAQIVCLAVQTALGGLEVCWEDTSVGSSHNLLLQVTPHGCLVLVIFLVQRHMSGCLLFTCTPLTN